MSNLGPCESTSLSSRSPGAFPRHYHLISVLDAGTLPAGSPSFLAAQTGRGLFEVGDAAQVGVGEEDASIKASEAAAFFRENRADSGANHGVTHAHDVNAGDALANVGVNALEVAENGFLPVSPIFFEQKLAILRGSAFGEGPVERPHGAVDVGAQALVHGVDITQRGGIEKDGVPGGFGAARVRIAIESEVGGKPGGIDEIVKPGKLFEKIRSKERGRGEDDEFGLEFGVAGKDACATASLRDAVDHLSRANVCAETLEEAARDPAIAFGPGERAFFLGLTGRKIMDTGPSGSVACESAVIVAASVVHVPMEKAGVKALLTKPIEEGK